MRHSAQVIYNGRPVELTMGFDNPISGYFMTIFPISGEDNPDADPETGLIYSNLDDTALQFPRMTSDIAHYKEVLRTMNIDVSPDFFGKVINN